VHGQLNFLRKFIKNMKKEKSKSHSEASDYTIIRKDLALKVLDATTRAILKEFYENCAEKYPNLLLVLKELIDTWEQNYSKSQCQFKASDLTKYLSKEIHKEALMLDRVSYELREEIKYFNDHLGDLLRTYCNKYIAVKNGKVIAVGDSYGEVSQKVRKSEYKKEKYVLIRKVTEEQPVHFVPFPLP
jgi:hypothetical protein